MNPADRNRMRRRFRPGRTTAAQRFDAQTEREVVARVMEVWAFVEAGSGDAFGPGCCPSGRAADGVSPLRAAIPIARDEE